MICKKSGNVIKNKTGLLIIDTFSHIMRECIILNNNGYILQFGRGLTEGEPVFSEY